VESQLFKIILWEINIDYLIQVKEQMSFHLLVCHLLIAWGKYDKRGRMSQGDQTAVQCHGYEYGFKS
jgi:hypothetical protein